MSDKRYTVAVDFDGVLHSYTTPWSTADACPDPPVEGAIDWLNKIVEDFDVVVLTTRGDQPGGNNAVLAWLRLHGYHGPDLLVTSKKIPALIYLDDRAVRFTGPGSFPSKHEIHRARPWHKPANPVVCVDDTAEGLARAFADALIPGAHGKPLITERFGSSDGSRAGFVVTGSEIRRSFRVIVEEHKAMSPSKPARPATP